ncbi:MAG: hypothetical protein ACR2OZ_20745 [Verrucomicrobiales bacterium]
MIYGLYFALAEPAERSWISVVVPPEIRGTAFGWYHCTTGLAALPSSVLFGWLWLQHGAAVAFSTGAALSVLAALLLTQTSPFQIESCIRLRLRDSP